MRYWREHPEEYEAIIRGGGDPHDAFKGAERVLTTKPTATQEKKKEPNDFESLLTNPVFEQRTESSAKLLQEQRFNSEENETNE